MKSKLMIIVIVIIMLIFVGCEKNENGFYTKGPWTGKHSKTFTQWSDTEINYFTGTKLDSLGFNQGGFDQKGYNKDGFDKYGFDKSGFNISGLNKNGYDKNGFNTSGLDKNGYDKEGYTKKGFNKRGIHKVTKTRYDEYGYNFYGKKNAFEKSHFVDNFGDPTGDKYIVQRIDGNFSNSATDNSPAYFHLIYTGNNDLRFDIYEYNLRNKAHYSSYEMYRYCLKDDKGNELRGIMSISTYLKGSLSIFSYDAVEMIKKANKIKVYIFEVDGDKWWNRRDTNYSFTIDCTGFIDGINYLK